MCKCNNKFTIYNSQFTVIFLASYKKRRRHSYHQNTNNKQHPHTKSLRFSKNRHRRTLKALRIMPSNDGEHETKFLDELNESIDLSPYGLTAYGRRYKGSILQSKIIGTNLFRIINRTKRQVLDAVAQ